MPSLLLTIGEKNSTRSIAKPRYRYNALLTV
jgi:hypothetical protein